MKPDGILKPIAITFVVALVLYIIAYSGIEHRRNVKGPWAVTFTRSFSGVPEIVVNQTTLGITNVQIVFPGGKVTATNSSEAYFVAQQPRPVPFPVAFGKCLFMDTTFLPGTLVFDCFGHEIQFIPRVLTIDKQERPWKSNEIISLPAK
jgi:hypothetical protein